MAKSSNKRGYIQNRVFIGLPWSLRARYDEIVDALMKKYPIEFVIIGKNDKQDAEELLDVIKQKISTSSYAVFDATYGNANVSLEYGYAEALGVDRALYLSANKKSTKNGENGTIISDLAGKKRNHYKQVAGLKRLLEDLAKKHAYTERFNRAMAGGSQRGGAKTRQRKLALKIIREASADIPVQRAKIIQVLQSDANSYNRAEIETAIKLLHKKELITVSSGNRATVIIS